MGCGVSRVWGVEWEVARVWGWRVRRVWGVGSSRVWGRWKVAECGALE